MPIKAVSPHSLYVQTVESSNHYRLFIDNLIQEGSEIHDLLNVLHDSCDLDTLELRINSAGGYVKHGQQFINVIKDKFKDRSISILEAEASSMAALMFMATDRRVIYPHSILMIHEVSMYMSGKASESLKQIMITMQTMKAYMHEIFGGMLTVEEVDDVFDGKDFWFNAEDMCRRGLATHIITGEGDTLTAEEYLVTLDGEPVDEDSDS